MNCVSKECILKLYNRRSAVRGIPIVVIMLTLMVTSEVRAQGSSVQGVPNAMQGFSQNRDKPVQINAASLELRDKDKAATFKGDVKVVQGDTTMRCKTLVVFYESNSSGSAAPTSPKPVMNSAMPGPGGSSAIRRLEAKGGVIVTQKDQTVTGETGVFDMKANTITMLGNVILTKGDNVLRGDRLTVDMTTGVSRVESNSGRVQGLFKSSGQSPSSLLPSSDSGQPAAAMGHTSSSPGKPINLNGLSGHSGR